MAAVSKDYNDVGTKWLAPKTLNTPAMCLKDNMKYTLLIYDLIHCTDYFEKQLFPNEK